MSRAGQTSRNTDRIIATIYKTKQYKHFAHVADAVAADFTGSNICGLCDRLLDVEYEGVPHLTTNDAIDHCHTTGRYRGRLCMRCNTLEGAEKSAAGGDVWMHARAVARRAACTTEHALRYIYGDTARHNTCSGSAPMEVD